MPQLPDVKVTILDGALGLRLPSGVGIHAAVGVCEKGAVNEIVAIADHSEIAAKLGAGPLADAVADALTAGASQVYAVRGQADVAASIGAVAKTGTGQGNMTAAGAPLNNFEVVVEIVDPGQLGVATFRVSLDAGRTFSPKRTIPADGAFAIPDTGISLTFTNYATDPPKSFQAGDRYSFTATAAQMSAANVNAAIDALFRDTREYGFIHVVGPSDAALWAALDARAREAEAAFRYIHFVAEARGPAAGETIDQWVTALSTNAASFASPRVSVVAGRVRVSDTLTGRQPDRNAAGLYCGRLVSIPVMRSPGRVRDGGLPSVLKLVPEGITDAHIADLDAARFVTLRQFVGLAGFYVTNGRMMAEPTSDFQYVELRRVMDKACAEVRREALAFEHAEASGEGLDALEAQLTRPLEAMQGAGEIRQGRVIVPRNQDIVGTSTLRVKVRIAPVGIMRWIEVEIGFENPVQAA